MSEIFGATATAPNSNERLEAMASGLTEGMLISFGWRSLMVGEMGDSYFVWDSSSGKELGGRMLAEGATTADLIEWVEAKAEFYGVTA